ncbi:MAG TPA: alpha/beta hydrolase, partial [Rhodocyclaceae bacterium]|nr:alpha/beta hydrolase [Rhodocyclaceae bacterium]
ERHDAPESWQERAEHRAGSWWEDWLAWLRPQSGAAGKAPPVDSKKFPALADAPGTYVLEP